MESIGHTHTHSHTDRHTQWVCPTFGRFATQGHFTLAKNLHQYLWFLVKRNPKRIFAYTKKAVTALMQVFYKSEVLWKVGDILRFMAFWLTKTKFHRNKNGLRQREKEIDLVQELAHVVMDLRSPTIYCLCAGEARNPCIIQDEAKCLRVRGLLV